MLLFYIDESGDTAIPRIRVGSNWVVDPKVSPWFVLAAVGIPATSRGDLAGNLEHIKDNFFPGWRDEPWGDNELKGRYLAAAHRRLDAGQRPLKPRGYRRLRTARKLEKLCEALSHLLRKFRPLTYAVAVDKNALVKKNASKRYQPEGIAYAFLQQRLALLVDNVYGDAEGVMMVADEQTSHEKLFRTGNMLRIRTQITRGLRIQPRFELILDRPVWIDSKLHPLDREILQVPDLAAGSVYDFVSGGTVPSHPYHLWPDFCASFATHWATGEIPDGGLAIYPRPETGYPALV